MYEEKTLQRHNFHIKHYKTHYLAEDLVPISTHVDQASAQNLDRMCLPDRLLTAHSPDRIADHASVYRPTLFKFAVKIIFFLLSFKNYPLT